ncbi:MAG TPA: short-chain fatty acyl-CoA regulator family protein [Caulobacteraceae bacterium]|nr:short-chain fatty acyl-CoA regulator family protein [Caulobacteraceae bacterium]
MAEPIERKLFLGVRLKRLRRDLGLTQTRMAEDLGVSPSYLNHLERNQRPLTAQFLLRLAAAYDIDIRSLSVDTEAADARDLAEVLADPIFKDLAIPRHEVDETAQNAPGVADAMVRLYRAWDERRRLIDLGALGRTEGGAGEGPALTPSDWVRDYIQGQRNFFAELDDIGERLAGELGDAGGEPGGDLAQRARERLFERHGVQVRIVPAEVLPDSLRRYDHHRRRLMISQALGGPGRVFALAYQLAIAEHDAELSAHVARSGAPGAPTARLLKVSLANYLAAAVMMPYEAFRETCEAGGYDIDLVRARFGAGFEQACQRMTTLSRPTARGVPFFMVRVDSAGNVSKRFAGGASPFSRFGGACPRWNVHSAFRAPGRILTQVVETPDGGRYFTIARTVWRAAAAYAPEDPELAIGLGCELKYAQRLAYARGLDLEKPRVIEIGPACRVCERPACPQRAAEPVGRALTVDLEAKSITSYPFAAA